MGNRQFVRRKAKTCLWMPWFAGRSIK